MLTLDKTAWFQPTQACLPARPEVNMLAQKAQDVSGHPDTTPKLLWCGQATQHHLPLAWLCFPRPLSLGKASSAPCSTLQQPWPGTR